MNHLYYGDNLTVLRDSIADASVDLIYLDPPFNSNASYNVLFRAPSGDQSAAQIEAFDDTWHWSEVAEDAFGQVMRSGHAPVATMLRAMRDFLGENDMMAYLAMMAVRLIELHRVLKPTGSLYLHCDPTASHYLKILLDAVFGATNFVNEISWRRTTGKADYKQGAQHFPRSRDIILRYRKDPKQLASFSQPFKVYSDEYAASKYRHVEPDGRRYRLSDLTAAKAGGDTKYEWRVKRLPGSTWEADLEDEYKSPRPECEYRGVTPYGGRIWVYNRERMKQVAREGRIRNIRTGVPEYKRYSDEMPGTPVSDDWDDIRPINSQAQERLGYPTQKPVALLGRIIAASSNLGDVVLDPFCGCGTTVHAAEKLGRQWIGIDITHLAIGLIERRLRKAFPTVQFQTHGVPHDIDGARELARRGRADGRHYFEFEKWALSLIDAQPGNMGKRGADGGFDGNLWFGPKSEGRAIVSVKSGDNVGRAMISDLRGVMERTGAQMGVFLTLTPPTRPMIAEAAAAGQFALPDFAPVPRLQIVTIEQAMTLRDRAVTLPARRDDAFRKPARHEDQSRQSSLDL